PDELSKVQPQAVLRSSDTPFGVGNMDLVLLDYVLYTGRKIHPAVHRSFPTRRSSDLRGACRPTSRAPAARRARARPRRAPRAARDRKSTRLNSSHVAISYAVFCLKKKNKITRPSTSSKRKNRCTRRKLTERCNCLLIN